MKIKLFVIIVICLSYYSCGQNENKNMNTSKQQQTNQQTTGTDQTNKKSQQDDPSNAQEKNKIMDNSGAIRFSFPSGTAPLTLSGKINGFGENIKYVFDAKKGQTLTASVKPQKGMGNIRISQIISPAGIADGPFPNPVNYTFAESGDYILVLSENQMAGDPWTGSYFLTIEIK